MSIVVINVSVDDMFMSFLEYLSVMDNILEEEELRIAERESMEDCFMQKNESLEIDIHCREANQEADECPICLETPSDGESVANLECSHFFHESCIREHAKYKPQCPVCRQAIKIC